MSEEKYPRTLPVLETEMTADYYTISLASATERITATLPKEYMEAVVLLWQQLQDGTAPEDYYRNRNYAGCWPKRGRTLV